HVALDLGIEIRDLARRPRVCRVGEDSPFPRVPLSALALDADVIINLPKIKTHVQMGMSLGVKNLFGAVSGKRKAVFHFRNGEDPVRFGRLLVAIARYLKPALTIADGIVVLERHGPTTGDPRPGEFLAASGDPVAVDRVVLDLVGVDPATVPYMEAARQMGYGCQDLDRIEVLGDAIADLRLTDYVQVARFSPINFTLPRVVKSVVRQVFYLVSARAEAWRGRG
ncbi:DUF362 domain-containing protein, partial [bacterium]|nr:DUF362 domain-containing protein [bacterium]